MKHIFVRNTGGIQASDRCISRLGEPNRQLSEPRFVRDVLFMPMVMPDKDLVARG